MYNKIKKWIKDIRYMGIIYSYITGAIALISPILSSKIKYRISMGEKLNLVDPQGFNEKLMWLNLYEPMSLKKICSDKYLVRSFVAERGCEEILNTLYGVYDSVEEINWGSLPDSFVLKCTYGAGSNYICPEKRNMNISEAKKILRKGLKPSRLKYAFEQHYSSKENRIVNEMYIDAFDNRPPHDYKFYCFNGEPKAILVISDRGGQSKKMFYDLEWNQLSQYSTNDGSKNKFPKPKNLEMMVTYAKKLCKGFTFVRVDLYDTDTQVIFGELTFTPAGCLSKAHNIAGDRYFGELLKLPLD